MADEELNKKLTFREFLSIQAWVLKLYFKISPIGISCLIITKIFQDSYGLINAFIFGLIIDQITEIVDKNGSTDQIYNYILILVFVRLVLTIANYTNGFFRNNLRIQAELKIQREYYLKIYDLGIQTLEDPDVTNKLHRANRYIYQLNNLIDNTMSALSLIIATTIAGLTVFSFFPILVPLVLLFTIPRLVQERYYLNKDWRLYLDNTEKVRKEYWNTDYLTMPSSLQEVFVTNSLNFFDSKFQAFSKWWGGKWQTHYSKWYAYSFFSEILNDIPIILGTVLIVRKVIDKSLTVGDFAFQFRSIDIFYSKLVDASMRFFSLRQDVVRYKEIKEIFEMKPIIKNGEVDFGIMTEPPSIKFENVKFKYPKSKDYVINNLNLEIKKGEKLAIVGKNGAGKTTLVKLISRFYKINEGNLLINDIDLDNIKIESLYENMGVLYQEFNKYGNLNVRENVTVGDYKKEHREEDIIKALDNADALEFVEKYEKKLDQILSERFKGGIRPSTGQWQKLALARFFYRNSPLLIFDEPTAAIDAESEYKIFNKIYDFFKNKTVIIISHRFSTVRNADRIIVFDRGEILEQGSHDELIKLDGHYAKAFKLQAEGYK